MAETRQTWRSSTKSTGQTLKHTFFRPFLALFVSHTRSLNVFHHPMSVHAHKNGPNCFSYNTTIVRWASNLINWILYTVWLHRLHRDTLIFSLQRERKRAAKLFVVWTQFPRSLHITSLAAKHTNYYWHTHTNAGIKTQSNNG